MEMDLERQELELKAQRYLDSMKGGVKVAGKDVKEMGTTTLIIGGVFLAAFLIGRKLFKKKKPKTFNDPSLNQLVVQSPKRESAIVRMIKEHITIFLVSLIKERLIAYLTEIEKKHEPVQ